MPYKILTHDYRPPLQGGAPVCDGIFPVTLPKVPLDTSSAECGAGWNYCADIETALSIAGLWPNGWSALVVEVDPGPDAIERGKKHRASTLTITGVVDDVLVRDAIERFSIRFGVFNEHMAAEQWAWFEALRRPLRDPVEVERALAVALGVRELSWTLKRHDSARDARAAWDAWAAWDARAAWNARNAWDAWAARDAWAALTVDYAATNEWIDYRPDFLSAGIRDAYKHGLAIAIPTGPNELGWAMVESDERHPAVIGSEAADAV